jgi:hypothetical protein
VRFCELGTDAPVREELRHLDEILFLAPPPFLGRVLAPCCACCLLRGCRSRGRSE